MRVLHLAAQFRLNRRNSKGKLVCPEFSSDIVTTLGVVGVVKA